MLPISLKFYLKLRQVIQSPGQTNDRVWKMRVSNILRSF